MPTLLNSEAHGEGISKDQPDLKAVTNLKLQSMRFGLNKSQLDISNKKIRYLKRLCF